MTKSAPCLSHPCGCTGCVFTQKPVNVPSSTHKVILTEKQYGCVHGGAVVESDGTVGIVREDRFHPLTTTGAQFLRENERPFPSL